MGHLSREPQAVGDMQRSLGEEHSRQREKPLQNSEARGCLGKCEQQQEGQRGWSRGSEGRKSQRGDGPALLAELHLGRGRLPGVARSELRPSYSACYSRQIHGNPLKKKSSSTFIVIARCTRHAYKNHRGSPFRIIHSAYLFDE